MNSVEFNLYINQAKAMEWKRESKSALEEVEQSNAVTLDFPGSKSHWIFRGASLKSRGGCNRVRNNER